METRNFETRNSELSSRSGPRPSREADVRCWHHAPLQRWPARIGHRLNAMSLVITSVPVPDFVESAWLVAVTCTVTGEGMSTGAVYTPAEVIVPSVAFPPGTPLMLQLTAVSDVFVTAAVNVTWFPNKTDAFVGFAVTAIGGGGEGDGGEDETLPEVQPSVHAASARRAINTSVLVLDLFSLLGERDRMSSQKQPKGQRREKGRGLRY